MIPTTGPDAQEELPVEQGAAVAAAWATIAGWMRMIGALTPVPNRNRSVT